MGQIFASVTESVPTNFQWIVSKLGAIAAKVVIGAPDSGKSTTMNILDVLFNCMKGHSIITLNDASNSAYLSLVEEFPGVPKTYVEYHLVCMFLVKTRKFCVF